ALTDERRTSAASRASSEAARTTRPHDLTSLPTRTRRLLERALSSDPRQRPSDVAALANEIADALVAARSRQVTRPAIVFLLLGVVGCALLLLVWWRRPAEIAPAAPAPTPSAATTSPAAPSAPPARLTVEIIKNTPRGPIDITAAAIVLSRSDGFRI